MSTRSGKRIHGSFHEDHIKTNDEVILKSERKTRSRYLKENSDENIVTKLKKRNNYVSYPTAEDCTEKAAPSYNNTKENSFSGQKATLKEQDLNVSLHLTDTIADAGKFVRQTRRTKKFTESTEQPLLNSAPEDGTKRIKKSKKKQVEKEAERLNNGKVLKVPKKSKHKKRKTVKNDDDLSPNKNNESVDSFHSAAGSPLTEETKLENQELNAIHTNSLRRASKRVKPDNNSEPEKLNELFEKKSKKRKISKLDDNVNDLLKDDNSVENKDDSTVENKDATFDKSNGEMVAILNSTIEKDSAKIGRNVKKLPSEKTESPQKILNSTYEKDTPNKINVTYEEEHKLIRKSLRKSNNENLNGTYDKSKESIHTTLNTTFEKETKINTTFEKDKPKCNEQNTTINAQSASNNDKSSDGSANLTYDKSDENLRISISDDSSADNIANTTPLLIESSLDESQTCDLSLKEKDIKNYHQKSQVTSTPPSKNTQSSMTPLKREGTFTMEGTDLTKCLEPKLSLERISINRMSVPSAGCTPFHISHSSQRDRSMLNMTHSIEKTGRRSSLATELIGRSTKVMFCSPINNPAVVAQQKRKVIKSNLKGSNKSFIFDESVCQAVRPATRKRSYTQNDADDARAKRKRLTEKQQVAVDRLSRPRTSSATVKFTESTPSKKVLTPFKKSSPSKTKTDAKLSRTKLPNFAALHQKQFAKMESLDECQERKAKRAKQLLTPTGAVNLIKKSSPETRGTTNKEPEDKPETPSKTPKMPSLQILKPGFTRFGFKMNKDTNPFNFTAKTETKPKENKPNGFLTRQPTQPSLNGVTSMRKEAAKQTVMREKSFTSLSDKRSVTRKEIRTTIKGVRTNRRFELQMQLRNINA